MSAPTHQAILVLGDQLSPDNPALRGVNASSCPVILIEAPGESTHVWTHKARIAVFISAMRHYAQSLANAGWTVRHVRLSDMQQPGLLERLEVVLTELGVTHLRMAEAGEWRLQRGIEALCKQRGVSLQCLEDDHFLCSRAEFAKWAAGRKQLRMEFFYRDMRRKHQVLMDTDGEPEGGQWNFDADNRSAYPKAGPGLIPPPPRFAPDAITQEVLAEVETRFADHPGSLAQFAWPVTPADAQAALDGFIADRLSTFGKFQDAMWTRTPFGWHSMLSVALNLHLISPLTVVKAAEAAWQRCDVPLADAEGFIRQVLGWREFIRGVYWLDMPDMAQANFFGHERPLPKWFWTGQSHMACMQDSIGQTLEHGYAHHSQRLMVTGNFALLAQLSPQAVADWYLAVYVDAVEWVELPNVAGMALFANGGRFTSKPYIASGAYIHRMSNYCKGCKYEPGTRTGEKACPFTLLYWAFLDRHEKMLSGNPRTALMAKNIQRLSSEQRETIRCDAAALLDGLDAV